MRRSECFRHDDFKVGKVSPSLGCAISRLSFLSSRFAALDFIRPPLAEIHMPVAPVKNPNSNDAVSHNHKGSDGVTINGFDVEKGSRLSATGCRLETKNKTNTNPRGTQTKRAKIFLSQR